MPSKQTAARKLCSGRGWQAATAAFRQWCAANAMPCALCGLAIRYDLRHPHRAALTVDHIQAIWNGGPPLDPANWQPAHHGCNASRGASEGNQLRKRRKQPPTSTTARW